MNDSDCYTETLDILTNMWEKRIVDWDVIGAFLAARGIIDVDTDPPDESNRNLEGEDL